MKLPNSSKYYILFHYSEIGLKGGNRKRFEEQLLKNIRQVLRGVVDTPTIRSYGRFLTPLPENFDWPLIQFRLKKVVGLAYFSLAEIVEQDTEKITETASRHMCSLGFSSFRVTTRRAQKKFLLNSTELSTVVGSAIQTQSGARVDLDNPEAVCYIEIFNDHAFVYTERIAGCRGLPVGSSGKAVSLLSSGIDSPVASWKIICRGVKLVFLHFHSIPFTTQASVRNTRRLVERLTEYQLAAKLYTVPFLEIQQS
ncbi:tRNA 4-thiouridine(8) synthase ThiI, partial [Candidatus Saccharibacteria bacterium]|nr:tRNA 4-thiouridine(8) synthase ThiI [Candidatus Saccharibacteria bacterium]NIV04448.1 tRNA 4-thiouridine(8) synthase ThiI [Calditrichia bacterium]NIW80193.1 tRNA 4-thiouridine(8) synthase ThiI [Calditrichia bacterium]